MRRLYVVAKPSSSFSDTLMFYFRKNVFEKIFFYMYILHTFLFLFLKIFLKYKQSADSKPGLYYACPTETCRSAFWRQFLSVRVSFSASCHHTRPNIFDFVWLIIHKNILKRFCSWNLLQKPFKFVSMS